MELIYDGSIASWVADRIGCNPFLNPVEMGVFDGATPLAGVVLDRIGICPELETKRCFFNVATDGSYQWQESDFEFIFSYVFEDMDVVVCYAFIHADNEASKTFCGGLGFSDTGERLAGFEKWSMTAEQAEYLP